MGFGWLMRGLLRRVKQSLAEALRILVISRWSLVVGRRRNVDVEWGVAGLGSQVSGRREFVVIPWRRDYRD